MSYRVEIRKSAIKKFVSWHLPDSVLVEVYLRLREVLPTQPTRYLQRARYPFDGMVYRFKFIDLENRLCEHVFSFLVQYSQDEEFLIVLTGAYMRQVGM